MKYIVVVSLYIRTKNIAFSLKLMERFNYNYFMLFISPKLKCIKSRNDFRIFVIIHHYQVECMCERYWIISNYLLFYTKNT